MTESLFTSDWFIYGLILVIGLPLVIIAINELIHGTKDRYPSITSPLSSIRNFVLPLVALGLVFSQILEFSRDSLVMKLMETAIWILVINGVLSIINTVFFSDSGGRNIKNRVPQLFLDIFRVLLVLLGIAIVLSAVWEADLSKLVTALGLGSFVIGLALQDTLGNLFSGIALVYEKPFTEGDFVEYDGTIGKIVEMNWRAIRILTRENELVIIPHLMIGHGKIKNFSKPTTNHTMRDIIGFSYDNPPNIVKEALLKTCEDTPGILNSPPPKIKTDSYGDSSINYEVEFTISDFTRRFDIRDDFMSRIWYTSRRYNLEIPFPQLTVHNASDSASAEDVKRDELHGSLDQIKEILPFHENDLNSLSTKSKLSYYGIQELVVNYEDMAGDLHIILSGEAKMYTLIGGQQKLVAELSDGDIFGELSLFRGKKSNFRVKAIKDLIIITIEADDVNTLVRTNSKLAQYLDEVMDAQNLKLRELKKAEKSQAKT